MTVFDMLCRSMWRRHTYLEYQVMICLAGVTDRQTDRQSDGQTSFNSSQRSRPMAPESSVGIASSE